MKNVETVKKSLEINGKEVSLETGELALQADGAVIAQMGETVVMATVVHQKDEEQFSYLPLFVEYQEKLYAGGKIKGSRWVKREGRPSDEAVLKARLVDRSLRPLFPKGYRNKIQVVLTILSFDEENDPDILSIIAASAALKISGVPWNGPVGAVRVGFNEGTFFINPGYKEREYSQLDLVVSGNKDAIIMLEAGAEEVQEDKVAEGVAFAHKEIKKIVDFIDEFANTVGVEQQEFIAEEKKELQDKIDKKVGKEIKKIVASMAKNYEEKEKLEVIKEDLKEELEKSGSDIADIVDKLFKKYMRKQVVEEGKRIDGRDYDTIREIYIKTGVLPRTHGSALFQRGKTQSLTITTLGPPSLEQFIESIEGEETKRYIHHYYMPPYSVGEVGRFGWPSRREIGHGALSERALKPMIPSEDKFPYTIRVVSEITSSNGSTSQASICGSSLSLMDAGVPVKKPVAGIAMGLIAKEIKNKKVQDYVLLTDIMGIEDFLGDMDFKLAGTKDGMTALQLDVKVVGITPELLSEAFEKAKQARLHILEKMNAVLKSPREGVSEYAPVIKVLQIEKDQIGSIIGPGGKTIRKITNETGATVDVDDEGKVTITALNPENLQKAVDWIEGLTKKVEVGEVYKECEVKNILPFGAFVELLPGKEGLVHVSNMADHFVKDPHDEVSVGDIVDVKVIKIDDRDRINLSMLLEDKKRGK